MGYFTGTLNTQNDIIAALQAAAVAAGWTVDRSGAVGTGDAAGQECLLHKGTNYVQLRSMQSSYGFFTSQTAFRRGPCCFITGATGYNAGAAWNAQPGTSFEGGPTAETTTKLAYVGMSPDSTSANTATGLEFPCPYRLFTFSNPDVVLMVIRATATKYQWIMFGNIEKFGAWDGGEFVAASNCSHPTSSGGNYPSSPVFSVSGNSRGRSYAPFYNMATGYNQSMRAQGVTNSTVRIVSGVAVSPNDWAYSAVTDPVAGDVRRWCGSANWLASPINERSPNRLNEVAVLSPFWIATQRDTQPNYTVVGRAAHIRQMPIDNFNPEDVFTLGPDKWMVFPFFEKGGVTGRYGWAINANEVP